MKQITVDELKVALTWHFVSCTVHLGCYSLYSPHLGRVLSLLKDISSYTEGVESSGMRGLRLDWVNSMSDTFIYFEAQFKHILHKCLRLYWDDDGWLESVTWVYSAITMITTVSNSVQINPPLKTNHWTNDYVTRRFPISLFITTKCGGCHHHHVLSSVKNVFPPLKRLPNNSQG